ncbi:MAG: MiaB/RimO family radical SAM methylthiotransferase [Desulfovibrionaceae bacterium]|nr:MiaB/RimO family radical SAM methylthiotransferase [Desulfovibrionaceae bacterium]MBF0513347.1 MiaB/RimO family radical SAM methylthiotransferase [Desulfovibrionaceae bacterium]
MDAGSFRIQTLGCKINQYESSWLREKLLARGLREAAPGEAAALVVINSCAVTGKAVADTRRLARKAAAESPHARIILTGCAASAATGELVKNPPPGEIVAGRADALSELAGPAALTPIAPFPGPAAKTRSRAVLKVQDGCGAACAFCIVPRARGGPVSRPAADVVAEAQALFRSGFAEIVVSGVNLGQYAAPDCPGFWDLIETLNNSLAPEFAGRAAIRLSSLDPGLLGEQAASVLHNAGLVLPHLHLSLQSGDARTLTRMRRRNYSPEGVASWLEKFRAVRPLFALGADLLAGFPGETGEEFAVTLAFVDALPLTYAHVFPFSARPQTLAARLPDQVPAPLAKQRASALRALAARKKKAFAKAVSALPTLTVVAEQGDSPRGLCEYYLDCQVASEPGSDAPRPGERLRVAPAGVKGATILTRRLS